VGHSTSDAVRRHLDPEPRVRLGLALAEAAIPTAMIDISDGLVADLGHILRLSGIGGVVNLADLPLSREYRELGGRYGADPYALCLGGGEDYELLFTLPEARLAEARALGSAADAPITVVGEIAAETGVCLVAPDGSRYEARASGYDHFRRSVRVQD